MAIITCHHGDGAIGTNERRRWRDEAVSERRRPTEPADSVSLKHKGDSWRWGQSEGKIRAERRSSQREKEAETPSFVCRIVRPLAPFLCHPTLPSSPLLATSDLALSSCLLWPCPLLIPHSLPFVWQASTYKWPLLLPPSTYYRIPFSGYLSTFEPLVPSVSPSSASFSTLLSKW